MAIPDEEGFHELRHLQDAHAGQELLARRRSLPLVARQAILVELPAHACLVPHGAVRDHAKHDLVVESVRIGRAVAPHELQLLVRLPGLQAVRAASDRLAAGLGRILGLPERGGGDDRQVEGEKTLGVGLAEPDPHGRPVGGLDRGEVFEPRAPGQSRDLRVPDALDRVANVVGGDGRPVFPGELRIEVKLVRQAVGGNGPRRGKRRHRTAVLVDSDEGPEHHLLDEQARLLGGRRGVQDQRVSDEMAHERRAGLCRRLGPGARNDRQTRERGEKEGKTLHWRLSTE